MSEVPEKAVQEAVQIANDVLREQLAAIGAAALDASRERIGELEAEVAALRAVAEAAQARRVAETGTARLCRTQDLNDALDALPPAPGGVGRKERE